ncbi:S8 family serine peptidase [Virgibacillus sp. NKC19-3]|uniref:S8 family serine peptidase n=1 Tax=Virgibacillus saliphilus TaxID=2831674 RepID=UPI001C9AEDCE|nr:S8 family serine peptidase [Virgibacillus sp. NKC19-3]MBY7144728.1 S8 family serine peptidase [Virgibacillus sp. NKC19-3]
MRYFLSIVAVTVLSIFLFVQTQASEEEDKQSIIVEVEGDVRDHKAYLEDHHPFVDVVATYDKLFNGLAIQGKPDKLKKMESLEFIKGIHTVQTYEANTSTAKKVSDEQSDAVIPSDLNNTTYTGKGVKVGVIDTGIDYDHPDLAGNFQGGYDLVDLDDDPMETMPDQGVPTLHGTHVAGIIAANGSLQGVAPDAEIYAYRALGPGGAGSSIQVIAALEQAVEDGMDVVNLSLGNAVNGPDYPTSVAVNRAADLGMSVVLANGNAGPDNWTVGSPATAANALSVGASSPPQRIPYLYEPSTEKQVPLISMVGAPTWNLEKDYPIVNGAEQSGGKIALLQRDDTSLYEKAKEAENHGAIAVVIANNTDGAFQGMVENDQDPISIPVASISQKDGAWLSKQIQADPLYLETAYQEAESSIADFSSRGPVTVNWDIKPDLLAPGTNILSTVPNGYQQLQGTSMAAPHVAGAVALVKEAKPNWTNEQISGALKTTASRMETEGSKEDDPSEPIMQGMGSIRPKQAIETNTIIHDPMLTFGKVSAYKETETIELEIENTTNQEQTYSFDIPKKEKGLTWNLPQTFTLDGGETKTIPVEVSINATQLREGVHQGWLTLSESDEVYHLPYLFVNQTADNPKAMGFEFALKPFSEDTFLYRLYVTEPAKRVTVDLYDPDTLVHDQTLLEMEDVQTGMNEGELDKSEIDRAGYYLALITVRLEDGKYESYQTPLYIGE